MGRGVECLASSQIRSFGWPVLVVSCVSSLPKAEAAKVLGAGETLSIDLVSKALIGIIIFTIGYEFSTEVCRGTDCEGSPLVFEESS